jgi:HPt (histidine-containing phosphotransfer) domain-containing protein
MPKARSLRVLFAGDDATARQLAAAGHHLVRVAGFPEALARLAGQPFDAVAVHAPEAASLVKALRQACGDPIAIIAFSTSDDARGPLLRAGADEVVGAAGELAAAVDALASTHDAEELMAITGEDFELLDQLSRLFRANAPRQLQALRQAVGSRRFDDMAHAAHRLKGALLVVAARPAARQAQAVERAARDQTLAGVEESMSLLGRMVPRLMAALSPRDHREEARP